MCTWSSSSLPSNISLSLCWANPRSTAPNSRRISPNSFLRRYFGIHTTWYLHSHLVWAKLWPLVMQNLLQVELWAVHADEVLHLSGFANLPLSPRHRLPFTLPNAFSNSPATP